MLMYDRSTNPPTSKLTLATSLHLMLGVTFPHRGTLGSAPTLPHPAVGDQGFVKPCWCRHHWHGCCCSASVGVGPAAPIRDGCPHLTYHVHKLVGSLIYIGYKLTLAMLLLLLFWANFAQPERHPPTVCPADKCHPQQSTLSFPSLHATSPLCKV